MSIEKHVRLEFVERPNLKNGYSGMLKIYSESPESFSKVYNKILQEDNIFFCIKPTKAYFFANEISINKLQYVSDSFPEQALLARDITSIKNVLQDQRNRMEEEQLQPQTRSFISEQQPIQAMLTQQFGVFSGNNIGKQESDNLSQQQIQNNSLNSGQSY